MRQAGLDRDTFLRQRRPGSHGQIRPFLRRERKATVTFPDLPGCITEGDTLEEPFEWRGGSRAAPTAWRKMATRYPTDLLRGSCSEGAFVTVIETWMPLVRDEMANRARRRL